MVLVVAKDLMVTKELLVKEEKLVLKDQKVQLEVVGLADHVVPEEDQAEEVPKVLVETEAQKAHVVLTVLVVSQVFVVCQAAKVFLAFPDLKVSRDRVEAEVVLEEKDQRAQKVF